MSAILTSVVPLFAVIFLGFFAGRTGILNESGVRGLVAFVFNFAMPPLLFRLMARAELADVSDWSFVAGYFASEVAMFLFGALVAGALFRQSFAERTIQGFGCAFSNGVLMTLPMLLWLYGEPGGVPALLIITLNVVTFSLVTMLLERASERAHASSGAILRQTVRSIVANPIIMAAALGLLYGLAGLEIPAVLDATLTFLGRAGAPTALFALGAALSVRRVAGSAGPVATMVVAKLFLHPLVAWAIFTYLLDLDPLWYNAGILFAACPVGLNVFIFAQHYDVGVATASTAILVSTALSMLTITALLLWLPPVPA